MATIADALTALGYGPDSGAWIAIRGNSYAGIEWADTPTATEAEVLAAIAELDTQSPPDWDGFNAYILADTAFQTATAQVRALAPSFTEALPSAYLLVGQGNAATFSFLIDQIYQIASVSEAQRNTWADTARDIYHLPAEFVAIVRG